MSDVLDNDCSQVFDRPSEVIYRADRQMQKSTNMAGDVLRASEFIDGHAHQLHLGCNGSRQHHPVDMHSSEIQYSVDSAQSLEARSRTRHAA